MMIKDLLPIGTVVMLRGGNKRIMIFGVKQSEENAANEAKEEFDYIGVFYPEGNIGLEYQFMFNHADIEQVYFRGYEDEERTEFLEKLAAIYSE
ncbi:MAG: hypothetical protein A4E55_00301 [Pelotomaculum sp. PtaU1.Bin035]|nr:MAG: hypothetical protein A4E55_00301 [Pelotomaculum sp. PtaU1.Bin035]